LLYRQTFAKILFRDGYKNGHYQQTVKNHYTKHRLLDFYADKLGLTPNYLITVIKRTSGISATEWIEKFVILEVQALLKSLARRRLQPNVINLRKK
jgi:AraC-like DNA-binding protein